MAEGRVGDVPELTALDQNMNYITSVIGSGNLQWFSNELVKKGFANQQTAQGILGITGVTVDSKVGQLMERVYGVIKNAMNKKEKYDLFVDIFSHNTMYKDLAQKLKNSVPVTDVEILRRELTSMVAQLREKEAELRLANEKITEQQQQIQTMDRKLFETQKQIYTKGRKLFATQQQLKQKEKYITRMFFFTATLTVAVLLKIYLFSHEVDRKENKMKAIITELHIELNGTMMGLVNGSMMGLQNNNDALKMEIEMEMNVTVTEIENNMSENMMSLRANERQLNVLKVEDNETEMKMDLVVTEVQNELKMSVMKIHGKELNLTETKVRISKQIVDEKQLLINHIIKNPKLSGPGLTSATVNHPTYFLVELTDSNGYQLPLQLNVTAQLELVPKATPTNQPEFTPIGSWLQRSTKQATPTSQPIITSLPIVMKSPSRYKVPYTAVARGQYKLHVQVNNTKINGSPFRVTVYPEPQKIDHPQGTMTHLNGPWGIAFNNHKHMIVSERDNHRVMCIFLDGTRKAFGSEGKGKAQMEQPRGIATDNANNIYVSSINKVQKFTSDGKLINVTGQYGNKDGEFDVPRGITVYKNELYVCDTDNHRIQVFDLDLNHTRSIGLRGEEKGEFDKPYDVKFDTAGNMYVAEWGNHRVQVLDSNGVFRRQFRLEEEEGKEKKSRPVGVHIIDKYVYVSDWGYNFIVVYKTSGQFVNIIGREGSNDGEFKGPHSITSDAYGFIYVCDLYNCRVQIF